MGKERGRAEGQRLFCRKVMDGTCAMTEGAEGVDCPGVVERGVAVGDVSRKAIGSWTFVLIIHNNTSIQPTEQRSSCASIPSIARESQLSPKAFSSPRSHKIAGQGQLEVPTWPHSHRTELLPWTTKRSRSSGATLKTRMASD